MKLIDGKSLASKIRSELKEEVKRLGVKPGLAVLLIGDDPASHTYVRLKEKAAAEIGMHFEKILLPQTIDEELVLVRIDELNRRADIHGILVQLPLPKPLSTAHIIPAILPEKDADGFHPENIKKFLAGPVRSRAPQGARSTTIGRAASNGAGTPAVTPVTTQAIVTLLSATQISLSGKHALILANSAVFAQPVKKMLTDHGVRTDIATKLTTDNLPPPLAGSRFIQQRIVAGQLTTTYDILITARGIPGSVTPAMVKEGAIVIDVGTTRVDDAIHGDADPAVVNKAGWLSPVPGGVGPLTVAYLLKNVVESAKRTVRGGTS